MRLILLLSSLLLVACDGGNLPTHSSKDISVRPLSDIKANLAFTCVHETIPEPLAEANVLFQYARWLQKNNQLKEDKTVDVEIERLYRIAAEHGHYKANINLQNGSMRGQFALLGEEHRRLSQELIDAGVATGYYFVGIFLKNGSAGLRADPDMSLRYFRKAADEGSALAQFYVGEKLDSVDSTREIGISMYRCAAEQGHGEAANTLGVYLQGKGAYPNALETFQLGVAAGISTSASLLSKGFRNPPATNQIHYLGQQEDLERAERYKTIWRILARYSYANPKVPEINEILPLPPAKLPPWDGKLQWLEERLANIPPEKPSEALIRRLAEAKHLEAATGRPTPTAVGFVRAGIRAPTCNSGQPCPQTGYWQAIRIANQYMLPFEDKTIRRFEQGEILPTLKVQYRRSRFLLPDKLLVRVEEIEWELYG